MHQEILISMNFIRVLISLFLITFENSYKNLNKFEFSKFLLLLFKLNKI